MNKGNKYYLTDRQIDLCVRALSSLGMAYCRLPSVYPNVGWYVDSAPREVEDCKSLIVKLQAKQALLERGYAPLLLEEYEKE